MFIDKPILSNSKMMTKSVEYSYLSPWLGNCMFLTTGKSLILISFTLKIPLICILRQVPGGRTVIVQPPAHWVRWGLVKPGVT